MIREWQGLVSATFYGGEVDLRIGSDPTDIVEYLADLEGHRVHLLIEDLDSPPGGALVVAEPSPSAGSGAAQADPSA